MKSAIIAIGIVLLAGYAAPEARAADPGAGKQVARTTCVACHGMGGIGITDQYPNLAGQKAPYLESQLKAFRDGTRNNPIMSPMAKQLSDNDIANLAAYYSQLEPK